MRGVCVGVGQCYCVQERERSRGRGATGPGAACCCECRGARRQPDAGLELRRCCCELCWRGDERGEQRGRVVDCCGGWSWSVWPLCGCSSGAVWSERRGHERGQRLRGVCVAVGQCDGVQERERSWGRGATGSGAACCCECGGARGQPDAGLELRRCCCELCGRCDERCEQRRRVCDCCWCWSWRSGVLWSCSSWAVWSERR